MIITSQSNNWQFECLGKNSDKYITFSVLIKKLHDNGKKNYIQTKIY